MNGLFLVNDGFLVSAVPERRLDTGGKLYSVFLTTSVETQS